MKMQGNTILIAGGASGIGRGLAELLCRLGNEVIVFDATPGAAEALARSHAGMKAVDLDLSCPWAVAGFAEQVGATHPGLNMLVNVAIAFPVRHLPGLHALLDDDDTPQRQEAYRLGVQQLTGTLLPRFRQQACGAVMNVSVGPALLPSNSSPGLPTMRDAMDGGIQACAVSVRKRWASATIEVINVSSPARGQGAGGVPLAEFVSNVAHLLAEGLHEETAIARLRSMWPATRPAVRQARDDLVSEVD